jgi:hypothetical protein
LLLLINGLFNLEIFSRCKRIKLCNFDSWQLWTLIEMTFIKLLSNLQNTSILKGCLFKNYCAISRRQDRATSSGKPYLKLKFSIQVVDKMKMGPIILYRCWTSGRRRCRCFRCPPTLEYHLTCCWNHSGGDAAIRKAVKTQRIMQPAWIDLQDSRSIQKML